MNTPPIETPFVEQLATLMMPWGWQRHVGRMYAYLLLQPEPVGLDELAAALAISKSNASVAARTLEQFGNARRHFEAGTRRIRYSAPGHHLGPFASRVELLSQLVALLDDDASPRAAPVAERLQVMADFYRDMAEAMQEVIERQRSGAGGSARREDRKKSA